MKLLMQFVVFVCLYVGYTLFTINRKAFAFLIPSLTSSNEISPIEAGKVLSSFSLAYTISKLAGKI